MAVKPSDSPGVVFSRQKKVSGQKQEQRHAEASCRKEPDAEEFAKPAHPGDPVRVKREHQLNRVIQHDEKCRRRANPVQTLISADLRHNMDETRLRRISPKDEARKEKYERSLRYLEEFDRG